MSWFEVLYVVSVGLFMLVVFMAALFWFLNCLYNEEWMLAPIAFVVWLLVTVTIVWFVGIDSAPTELPVR